MQMKISGHFAELERLGPLSVVEVFVLNESKLRGEAKHEEALKALESIGDLAREETVRSVLVKHPRLIQLLCDGLISFKRGESKALAARCIGNLAIGFDQVRLDVLRLGGVDVLLDLLSNDELAVVSKAFGALGNLLCGVEDVQKRVLEKGGLDKAIEAIARTNDSAILIFGLRYIHNLLEYERAQKSLRFEFGKTLIDIVKTHANPEIDQEMVRIVSVLNSEHGGQVYDFGWIQFVESMIGSNEVESCVVSLECIGELLSKGFMKWFNFDSVLPQLKSLLEVNEQEEIVPILHICVHLSIDRNAALQILHYQIPVDLLKLAKGEDERIRSLVYMIIGNLAHDQDLTKKILSIDGILSVLQLVLQTAETREKPKVLSALRNIALFAEDIDCFVENGYIDMFLDLIQVKSESDTFDDQIVFHCAVLLRLLTLKSGATAESIASHSHGLGILIDAFRMDRNMPVRYELARLFKSLAVEEVSSHLVLNRIGSDVINIMCSSDYPVLHCEAIEMLVFFVNSDPSGLVTAAGFDVSMQNMLQVEGLGEKVVALLKKLESSCDEKLYSNFVSCGIQEILDRSEQIQ